MSDLRNKYKATTIKELKKSVEADDAALSLGKGNNSFLEIVDGKNRFRIAPKSTNDKSFYHSRAMCWVSIEDNEGNMVRRPVFNSKQHGGTKLDVIEEYISFVKSSLENIEGKTEKVIKANQEKLKAFLDWKEGLKYNFDWLAYAWPLTKTEDGFEKGKIGLLGMNKTVRDGVNNAAIVDDEDDDTIIPDPFTDPDTGKPILITYDGKGKKATDKYKVQMLPKALRLSDEDLEELDKQTPLSKLLENVYTRKDFDRAVEGIKNYDIENEIDLFDDEEFQEILAKVSKQYGASDEDDKAPKKKSKKPADDDDDDDEPAKPIAKKKQVAEEDDDEEEAPKKKIIKKESDKFDKMDRDDLKEYIVENEYDIKLLKADSDDEIRTKIRTFESKKKVEDEDEEEEEAPKSKTVSKKQAEVDDDDEDEKPVEKSKTSAKKQVADDDDDDSDDINEKLEAIKSKMKAKSATK